MIERSLSDADRVRDTLHWRTSCAECGAWVRWIGLVGLRVMRVQADGSLTWASARVCRRCASRALLLPQRVPGSGHLRAVNAMPEDDDLNNNNNGGTNAAGTTHEQPSE